MSRLRCELCRETRQWPCRGPKPPISRFNIRRSITYQTGSRKDLIAVHSRPDDAPDRRASCIIG